MKKLAVFLSLFVLAGCIPTKKYAKAYEGPDVPASEVALLKPVSGIKIEKIDGKYIGADSATSFETYDYEISILPGPHRITVSFDNGTIYSKGVVPVEFTAVAGRKYLVEKGIEMFSDEWHPSVADVTDTPKCFSVNADVIWRTGC